MQKMNFSPQRIEQGALKGKGDFNQSDGIADGNNTSGAQASIGLVIGVENTS